MTTTPTIWKAKFYPNFLSTAGDQDEPQSVGLADGTILTIWNDSLGGTSPGYDVVGQSFDPTGANTGAQHQINSAYKNADEMEAKIVALPDGDYVVAYGEFNNNNGNFIVVERFHGDGTPVRYNIITDVDFADDNRGWAITADNNGNYIVAFESGFDVKAIVYNYVSNNPLPRYDAGYNSSHIDPLEDIAAFDDGNIITLSTQVDESGGAFGNVAFRISTTGTGATVRSGLLAGDVPDHEANALDVAVLSGGEFVVAYGYYNGGDLRNYMRIGQGDDPTSAIGPEILITQGIYDDVHLVALQDGGFLVVWGSGTGVYCTRYTRVGGVIGQTIQIADHAANGYNIGEPSLTSDGRVLVPFTNGNGELAEVIVDPRENLIHGTANADVITTQVGDTLLFGEAGDDKLYGVAGNDEIRGDAGNDALFGGGGTDLLNGGVDDDAIYGQGGDDTLKGEAGVDTLRGGVGNDTYVLQDLHRPDQISKFVYDTVIEAAGQGTDTVIVTHVHNSLVSGYTLPTNVENGTVGGTEAFNLTGNALANQLTGNGAANTLAGVDGADTLNGGGGADTLQGGPGDDRYYVDNINDVVIEAGDAGSDRVLASVSYTLGAGQSIELFTTVNALGTAAVNLAGNDLVQRIDGNAGDNIIDGGGGADTMYGGRGNDKYVVDNSGDVTNEAAAAGSDRMLTSTANYALGAGQSIELFTTTNAAGTSALYLTGNELAQTLNGNAGNNAINGKGGNDTLVGFGGADRFVFNTAPGAGNIDNITDFAAGDDEIDLENAIFTALPTPGTLAAGAFFIGAAAHDADDRIIYNSVTGALTYDSNGNAPGGATQFATLPTGLALTNGDFVIV